MENKSLAAVESAGAHAGIAVEDLFLATKRILATTMEQSDKARLLASLSTAVEGLRRVIDVIGEIDLAIRKISL